MLTISQRIKEEYCVTGETKYPEIMLLATKRIFEELEGENPERLLSLEVIDSLCDLLYNL